MNWPVRVNNKMKHELINGVNDNENKKNHSQKPKIGRDDD